MSQQITIGDLFEQSDHEHVSVILGAIWCTMLGVQTPEQTSIVALVGTILQTANIFAGALDVLDPDDAAAVREYIDAQTKNGVNWNSLTTPDKMGVNWNKKEPADNDKPSKPDKPGKPEPTDGPGPFLGNV